MLLLEDLKWFVTSPWPGDLILLQVQQTDCNPLMPGPAEFCGRLLKLPVSFDGRASWDRDTYMTGKKASGFLSAFCSYLRDHSGV